MTAAFMMKPLDHLHKNVSRVSKGDLSYQIKVNTTDEIGELAMAFNAMISELRKAKVELVEWGNTLEKKVQQKREAIQTE